MTPILCFHIYDYLSIPGITVIFLFINAYEGSIDSHKYFKFSNHICSFTSMTTDIFLCGRHMFFLIYTNNFRHFTPLCIYTQCLCPWSVKEQLQIIYILQRYLFFDISDHLSISCLADMLVFAKAYENLSGIYKYFTFENHVYSFTSMITYVFLVWQSYLLLQKVLKV